MKAVLHYMDPGGKGIQERHLSILYSSMRQAVGFLDFLPQYPTVFLGSYRIEEAAIAGTEATCSSESLPSARRNSLEGQAQPPGAGGKGDDSPVSPIIVISSDSEGESVERPVKPVQRPARYLIFYISFLI